MPSISKFTVVTPSYNQAIYLPETIESVLSQEGSFYIEYFIMDGGSTDGSAEIIRRYADLVTSGAWKSNSKGISIYWVSERDRGQSDAINKGLRRATGDVCSYLNSDDTYPPGTLARAAQEFDRHPEADFIYGDGEVIDEHSNLQWVWLSRPYNHRLLTSYHFWWNAFTNYILQQATFWRTSAMGKIGYFDESMHMAMDLEYWVRAGAAGLVLHHVPAKLGRFRMIQGTKSLSSPTAFWQDQLELFRRHHGTARMKRFLSYYYYNVAMHNEFDMSRTQEAGEVVFAQWANLPQEEAAHLKAAAPGALAAAALLGALTLQQKGDYLGARKLYDFAVHHNKGIRLHYWALLYRIRRVLNPGVLKWMGAGWNVIVGWYRKTWIDYRYFEAKER